jgi:hypothetical protein
MSWMDLLLGRSNDKTIVIDMAMTGVADAAAYEAFTKWAEDEIYKATGLFLLCNPDGARVNGGIAPGEITKELPDENGNARLKLQYRILDMEDDETSTLRVLGGYIREALHCDRFTGAARFSDIPTLPEGAEFTVSMRYIDPQEIGRMTGGGRGNK